MSAIVSPYKDQIKRLQQLLQLPSILMPILSLTTLHLAAEGNLMTFFFWPFLSLNACASFEEAPAWIGLSWPVIIIFTVLADESVLKNMQSVALPALADELLDLDVCNLAVAIDQLGGLKLEPLNVV
jgi:hypothetical protein